MWGWRAINRLPYATESLLTRASRKAVTLRRRRTSVGEVLHVGSVRHPFRQGLPLQDAGLVAGHSAP